MCCIAFLDVDVDLMGKPKFGPSTQPTFGTFDTMKTPKAMYLMCMQ
jgi:hypothetical protein